MRHRPLALGIAAALAMTAVQARAGAPVMSSAWLLQQRQNATPGTAAVPSANPLAGLAAQNAGQLLQQRVVQQSIANLGHAAQAVAAQMAAQQQAALKAQALATTPVPNGLAPGGLQVAKGATPGSSLWQNAHAPVQTQAGGRTNVAIRQTAQKAILTWNSFNVGRQTTVHFDQRGGNQNDGSNNWIALNRIQDPSGVPSQILGQIQAEGTVYLLNRNGIVFGAGSQVNTRSFLASSLDLFSSDTAASDNAFLQGGISGQAAVSGFLTTDGVLAHLRQYGDVTIEQGASITAGAQGFALVAAPHVANAGAIVADDGQAILAAGLQFNNKAGSSNGGALQVFAGNAPYPFDSLDAYRVTNSGLVQARRGSVHMLGHEVDQAGVVLASTSISYPGSIELDARDQGDGSDDGYTRDGALNLASGSVTAVLPEKDGATTSSSPAANAAFVPSSVNLAGNSVTFAKGALLEAPGAKLTVTALQQTTGGQADPRPTAGRIYVDDQATIDVSGLANVELPISALLVTIPRIGQNELADSPLLRNSFLYTQQNLVVDSTQSGTRADGLSWIGSPILNVAGYVENVPREVGQLMTKGGSISLAGSQVIVRGGAQLNLDGGFLSYQPGWVDTPNLLGANGRVYNIADADPNVGYVGFAGQYTQDHNRWGVSQTWTNPLLAGASRWDGGFIVGGGAGSLGIVASDALVLDGQISAQAFAGRNQVVQGAQPANGSFSLSTAMSGGLLPNRSGYMPGILLQQSSLVLDELDPTFKSDTPWNLALDAQDPDTTTADDDLRRWLPLSADMLQRAGFASLKLDTSDTAGSLTSAGQILEQAGTTLSLRPGGAIDFTANRITVLGTLRAPAGSISLTSTGPFSSNVKGLQDAQGQPLSADITIGQHGVLDVDGLWVNDRGQSADALIGDRYVNAGSISLNTQQGLRADTGEDGTGAIVLQPGSVLDASSGGYVGADGQLELSNGVPVGQGGDISLLTYTGDNFGNQQVTPARLDSGSIQLGGSLRAYGFSGGGSLSLQASQIQIGGNPADLAMPSGLYLNPAFFAGQGFDRYALNSITDASIAPGSVVRVARDNLLPDYQALLAAPTGADLYARDAAHPQGVYTSLGQLDAYHRYVTRDTGSGQGPGFSLVAGEYRGWHATPASSSPVDFPGVSGSLWIGQNARILADAGASVGLGGAQSVVVLGTIDAPGGDIEVGISAQSGPAPEIWLGAQAVLDASGVSLVDPWVSEVRGANGANFLPRTGLVLAGGKVGLTANQGYLVTSAGSTIDVSGAADRYDLPGPADGRFGAGIYYAPTSVWSDAGSIGLAASKGMYADGLLAARGGAPAAEGGSLTIQGLENPNASTGAYRLQGVLIQQGGELVPQGLKYGDPVEPGVASGILHFAADRLRDSGIASLAVDTPLLGFAGDVNFKLGRSFTSTASNYLALPEGSPSLGVTAGGYAQGNGTVRIAAPYVALNGNRGIDGAPTALAGDGKLQVDADFIDLGGILDLQQWAGASFRSGGDIRFYQDPTAAYSGGQVKPGTLFSTGDLAFQAAQLYPATGYRFAIDANPSGLGDAHGQPLSTTVSILPNGPAGTLLSAGGALLIDADRIEQAGTVRVPSGQLVLGVQDPTTEAAAFGLGPTAAPLVATQSVHLAAGGITSVSLDGATVPYGTTIDGTEWRYSGDPLAESPDLTAPPAKQLSIQGGDLALDAGATIDLSGGGKLQAAEWVAGTGGTRDVLSQFETDYSAGTTGTRLPQYPDGRAVYAILPGYAAPVGAHDAALEKGAGAGPAVGQAVYLSGAPGLPAGYYTLLPGKYASLPGAYRLVQDTGAIDSVLGNNSVLPDGSFSVTGYMADALNGARAARNTTFLLQSGQVWQQYSQYRLSDADTFFAKQASQSGAAPPPLPEDAGHLILAASKTLNLGASLTAEPAAGGRGSQVDIAAQAIQVLGAKQTARDGYLAISADGLTALGAGSLLLGGTRSTDAGGNDQVDTIARSVVISNDSAHPLAGPEILLTADDGGDSGAQGLLLERGSDIEARGQASGAAGRQLVFGTAAGTDANGNPITAAGGDGALLRASQNGAAPIVRNAVSGASGRLAIESGATIQGGAALSLDATGAASVDPDASFAAAAIDVTSSLITFAGAGANIAAGTGGLVIGAKTFELFRDARQVSLRSRSAIDFAGDVTVNLAHVLSLDAGALASDGGQVNISADTLALGNALGAGVPGFAAGKGRLNLDAGELDFTAGNGTVQGFGSVTANASRGMAGQGSGGIDFGNLDVNLRTPLFLAESGADTRLTTTGALSIAGNGGTPFQREAIGGALSFAGGSLAVSTDLEAPAGNLSLKAGRGDLEVGTGATLDTAGINKTFFDTTTYAVGGTLSLAAPQGSVELRPGSTVNFGGGGQGGDAGSLDIQAGGSVLLGGRLDGHAAAGYKGGFFTLDSGDAVDLDAITALSQAGGITGALSISSGAGNLKLSAGQSLKAGNVYLSAHGGSGLPGAAEGNVDIDGTIDISGPAAGNIQLYGRSGVDVEGSLLATSSIPEQRGGSVTLGTRGVGDGSFNAAYGYENVRPGASGSIRLGAQARIDVSGGSPDAFAGGSVSFRAPLLADGDVPIAIGGGIRGARVVTIEPYATWSTADASADASKHFDGLIDPSGWYQGNAGGAASLVAGTWADANGRILPPPPDAATLKQYLQQDYFVPTTANADHQAFYGYVDGDPGKGPGTLMGYVQQPGFAFGNRYAGIANVQVRPGIELDSPANGPNGGTISLLTNWNLGAGVTNGDGSITLAYRYQGLAPILTVRAAGDLDIQASLSDGFYQQNTGATLISPPNSGGGGANTYAAALASYQEAQQYLDANSNWDSGSIRLAAGGNQDIRSDPYYQPLTAPLQDQSAGYYANYGNYIGEIGDGSSGNGWAVAFVASDKGTGFLGYAPTPLNNAPQPASYSAYGDYIAAYGRWLNANFDSAHTAYTPFAPLWPVDQGNYGQYSSDYALYLAEHASYYGYVQSRVSVQSPAQNNQFVPQLFYAPKAPAANQGSGNPAYDQALVAYQQVQQSLDATGVWNGTVTLIDGTTKDINADPYYEPLTAPLKNQSNDYYSNYQSYIGEFGNANDPTSWAGSFYAYNNPVYVGFLSYAPSNPVNITAPSPSSYSSYSDYVSNYENWLVNFDAASQDSYSYTPAPILLPINSAGYSNYTSNYANYISGHQFYYNYLLGDILFDPSGSLGVHLFYAPFAPAADPMSDGNGGGISTTLPVPPASANNSPSNMPGLGNPASFASATLLGGSSSSYRLVAGANLAASDPLSVVAGPAGTVNLAGHFTVKDTLASAGGGKATGLNLQFPTTIRTGTGSIDVAAAGDIDWQDAQAPATIYTAGEAAAGTSADTGVSVLRPGNGLPEMLVTGQVNPVHAGDISLAAQGSINGVEQVIDTDGSVTGTPANFIGQYWWPWMQTGNSADGSRSSINYANFGQGVLSAGGDVRVSAGGNISDLSVSLPTTWYANPDGKTVTTVGGGNLEVRAGGDILSGSYFVAKGAGSLSAGGSIGADFDFTVPSGQYPLGGITTPVSTLLAAQDAQIEVTARGSADIGGVFNPSYYYDPNLNSLLPAGHFDAQSYSADASLSVTAASGDLSFDSLRMPGALFGYGIGSTGNASPVLPSTLNLTALAGDLNIQGAGSLYPSASGNLNLLADGSVKFSQQVYTLASAPGSGTLDNPNFGLIDALASLLPSPLQPLGGDPGDYGLLMGGYGYINSSTQSSYSSLLHAPDPLHGQDPEPVRIYALHGDVVDGIQAPNGFQYLSLNIAPSKPAQVYAGRDIVNLSFTGQQTHDADITRIFAGRDIYDTALSDSAFSLGSLIAYELVPSLLLGGPGSFLVEAGRNIGPLANQTEVATNPNYQINTPPTGIETVGNLINPYLPHQSADISVLYGIGPGMDTAAFLNTYLHGADGFGSLLPDLVQFMEQRDAGIVVDTGYAQDKLSITLSADQALAEFEQQPDDVQRLFADKELFKLLSQVGADYNDASSPYYHQYARGYAALGSLFPAALGYTENGSGQGGLNGAAQPVDTGDLDIRSSTIQTQQGGDITILGPGGQALVGSAAAPPVITDSRGNVVAGPNSMGIITLEKGNVNIFTDRSVLLAQSRIFTEQGGDMVIWSSNGDINAGQGAKTTAEIPPPTYLCTIDAWCRIDARGQVSGAGIATLQTVPGAPTGSVYLIAPRGTVDAGDAGIRVSGDLVVAAARVANADNIQVQGEKIGVPVVASVNVSALTAASAAAGAASKAAEDMARQQQSDARSNQPSIISVQVLGFGGGDDGAGTQKPANPAAYDPDSPVQVLGAGKLDGKRKAMLTTAERKHLDEGSAWAR